MVNITDRIASSALRPDGWAYLDWVTGVVRIDSSREEWECVRRQLNSRDHVSAHELTPKEVLLLETVTHEVTHFFQVCTTGYLYRVAQELYAVLVDALPTDIKSIDELPASVIEHAAGRLTAIKEEQLCAPGPRGLDVVSIVESAAFMIQKLHHYPALTPQEYQWTLAGQPSVYSAAYNVAREYLGEQALGTYPVLASLSLWTEHPAESLVGLCEGLAAHSAESRKEIQFGHLVDALCRVGGFIGPPWLGSARRDFPEYDVSIRRLDRLADEGRFDRQAYLLRPFLDENVRTLADEAMPPIIFNEDDAGRLAFRWPPSWSEISDDEKMAKAKILLLLFAISTHVQRSSAA